MKANRIVLLSLLMLSILVSGCGTSAPNSSETYESTRAETTETIQMPEDVYEFPVMVSEDRGLTISLHLEELEDFSAKEIRKIQIYDGDQLLQTITKDDVPEVIDYAWDGLFLNESNKVGLPDARDLNFDGAEDFGLLAVSAYPNNVPYSYFFWNAEKELFEYQLTAFGPGWLQVDEVGKCLVEISTSGAETYKKVFAVDPGGAVTVLSQANYTVNTTPATIDGYVYWGGSGSDASPNRVSVTMSLANVMHGEDAYNHLLLSDSELEGPGPGQEYIVIILNVKYEDGDLDVLDMSENIARQPGYSLHFALPNETSNAIDVTYSLADPIYSIQLSKGEIASGSVAFLQEIGNTQPLYFDGFDQITTFHIQ